MIFTDFCEKGLVSLYVHRGLHWGSLEVDFAVVSDRGVSIGCFWSHGGIMFLARTVAG